jgi:anaerobic ribonucleoside-triphosphate reductase activating protein
LTGPDQERFGDAAAIAEREQRLQVSYDGRQVWLIGIPRRGDLGRLEHGLSSRRLTIEGQSWRA